MSEQNNNENELLRMFLSVDFNNIPPEILKPLGDQIHKVNLKRDMQEATARIGVLENDFKELKVDQNSLKLQTKDNTKEIIQMKQREQELLEAQEGYAIQTGIAEKMYPNQVQGMMSRDTIGLFYFAFGLRGINGLIHSRFVADTAGKAKKENKLFYKGYDKRGSKPVPYWSANAIKMKEIFESKLSEFGLLQEFYNAENNDQLADIAILACSSRLRKEFHHDLDIAGDKEQLKREVKTIFKINREEPS